jgi:hypothetical protein
MTSEIAPTRVSTATLLAWGSPMGVAVGLAGAYPTWRLGGPTALAGEGVAGVIVVAAVTIAGLLVDRMAAGGPLAPATEFCASRVFRMLSCAALGLIAAWIAIGSVVAMLVWLALFYTVVLVAEAISLARAWRWSAKAYLWEPLKKRLAKYLA